MGLGAGADLTQGDIGFDVQVHFDSPKIPGKESPSLSGQNVLPVGCHD